MAFWTKQLHFNTCKCLPVRCVFSVGALVSQRRVVVMVGGRAVKLTLMKMTTPLAGVAMVKISVPTTTSSRWPVSFFLLGLSLPVFLQ